MRKITEFDNFDIESATKSLMEKFEEKMLDSDFLNYTQSLNVPDCYLYTSEIERSISEHKNCLDCTGLNNCPNLIKGHCFNIVNDNNSVVEHYVVCDKTRNLEYLKNITIFGKTKDNVDFSQDKEFFKDSARKDVLAYIKEISMENTLNHKGIYLQGSFGTGKSFIMMMLVKSLAKRGYKCGYAYFPELLVELKKEFSENRQSLLEKIKKLDVLVIDDIGSEKVTEWSRDEVLGTILQYRMDNRLFTCFTSNYTTEELLKHYNKDQELIKANRIIDRIGFLTKPFNLISKNYRTKNTV